MCVAIIIKGDHRPSLNDLQNMHAHNSDGAGVGWIAKTKGRRVCRWVKGLDPMGVHKLLDKLPRPILVHFRYATVGGSVPELTHPFPVSTDMNAAVTGEAPEILIHNGHWSGWDDWYNTFAKHIVSPPQGKWSDTRMAAYLMALYPKERDEIAAEVGGKVALLSAADGHAWYWGHWTEEKEVMYSNTYWRATRAPSRFVSDGYEEYANWYGYSSGQSGYRYSATKGYYKDEQDKARAVDTGKAKTWDQYVASRPAEPLNHGRGTRMADFEDVPTEVGKEVASIDSPSFRGPEQLRGPSESQAETQQEVKRLIAGDSKTKAEIKAAAGVVARKVVQNAGTQVHQLVEVSGRDKKGVMHTWFELEPRGSAVTESTVISG